MGTRRFDDDLWVYRDKRGRKHIRMPEGCTDEAGTCRWMTDDEESGEKTADPPDEGTVADDQRAKAPRDGTWRRTADPPGPGARANDERAEACASAVRFLVGEGAEQGPDPTVPVRKVRNISRQPAPYGGDRRMGRQLGTAGPL